MQTKLLDKIELIDNKLYFKDVFETTYFLPNLTKLHQLYHETNDAKIKANILPILKQDLGSILVAEIMIDAFHNVTLKRLETGEISKNIKHVHDYYIIPKSHYFLAKKMFEEKNEEAFETCHFSMFPFGLAIVRSAFPDYTNPYTFIPSLY